MRDTFVLHLADSIARFALAFAFSSFPHDLLVLVLVDFVRKHSSCCLVCRRWRDLAHHQHLNVNGKNCNGIPRLLANYPSSKLVLGHDIDSAVLKMVLKLNMQELPVESIFISGPIWHNADYSIDLAAVLRRSLVALRKADLTLYNRAPDGGLHEVLACLASADRLEFLALNMVAVDCMHLDLLRPLLPKLRALDLDAPAFPHQPPDSVPALIHEVGCSSALLEVLKFCFTGGDAPMLESISACLPKMSRLRCLHLSVVSLAAVRQLCPALGKCVALRRLSVGLMQGAALQPILAAVVELPLLLSLDFRLDASSPGFEMVRRAFSRVGRRLRGGSPLLIRISASDWAASAAVTKRLNTYCTKMNQLHPSNSLDEVGQILPHFHLLL